MEPEQESCLMDGGSFGLDYNTLLKALDGYPNKILENPDCCNRNLKIVFKPSDKDWLWKYAT